MFIGLQILFLIVYLYFTGRKPSLLFKDFFGIGDALFLLITSFYFNPIEFVLFSLLCYIAIVVGYGLLFLIKRKSTTIPLAGFIALFFAFYIVASWQNSNFLSQFAYDIVTYIV
ncbi:MAG TPA: hypothetical protein DIW31_11825 [Bacteroidales bacterium]|nr:hypothetical protein [Bacteroidales bacterium]